MLPPLSDAVESARLYHGSSSLPLLVAIYLYNRMKAKVEWAARVCRLDPEKLRVNVREAAIEEGPIRPVEGKDYPNPLPPLPKPPKR